MISTVIVKAREVIRNRNNRLKAQGKIKFFCIGRNKTGTTSLKRAFEDLGYPVGKQRTAEKLTDQYYFSGNFEPIIKYCLSAQVFQDIPFSYPETFKYMDEAYPDSKFILTIRDDAEQWYNSVTKFHAKKFGGGSMPTAVQLRKEKFIRKGFMYNTVILHGTSDQDPYNKKIFMDHYRKYNKSVIDYFKDRPNDLLIINIGKKEDFLRFTTFIGAKSPFDDFPWMNKT